MTTIADVVYGRHETAALIEADAYAPRTLDQRYRIYRLDGGELRLLATTPDRVETTLTTLRAEGEIGLDDAVGVLDSCPGGKPRETGQWLVSPWAGR